MSLIGGSSNSDFNFDGFGNFSFDDLVSINSGVENSSSDIKIQKMKKTEVFADIRKIDSADHECIDFYDASRFVKLGKDQLPPSERILAGLLLEKEGHAPVLMTRAGEAKQLDKKFIRIHRESDDGTECISDFGSREITIGSLNDSQYKRIHSEAMTHLTFIARQQKEVDSEEKTGIKLKELANQKEFTSNFKKDQTVVANKIFQGQIEAFSKNRQKLNQKIEFLFEQERISEERKTKALDKKKDDKDEMIKIQEFKKEIV